MVEITLTEQIKGKKIMKINEGSLRYLWGREEKHEQISKKKKKKKKCGRKYLKIL